MESIIKLITEGGVISFHIHERLANLILCTVSIDIDRRLRDISVKSNKIQLSIYDINRFCLYLKETILDAAELVESDVFVPNNLDFQFYTLGGEILSNEYSYCSINFMVNIGAASNELSNSYIGFESVVLIQEVQYFYDKLSAVAVLGESSSGDTVLGSSGSSGQLGSSGSK